MQHAINVVQTNFEVEFIADDRTVYEKKLAAKWDVYIGNSPEWSKNSKCPGGPFLSPNYDDFESFCTKPAASGKWPEVGFESWCNLLGRYTFLVAQHVPLETVSLCSFAVMGTAYIRDEPLPTTIELLKGTSTTLTVEHVHAELTIGNTLAIDLRLSSESTFRTVSLSNWATATDVRIDTGGLTAGDYTLILESFDKNSGNIRSTLKRDEITVRVVDIPAYPETVDPEPQLVTVFSG